MGGGESEYNGGSGKETAQWQRRVGRRELNVEKLSVCPSRAGQGCVYSVYLDGLSSYGRVEGPFIPVEGLGVARGLKEIST